MEREILRRDIYYANLNLAIGSEQGGTRPVLIIQNNTGNKYSPTVIIAAMSSKMKTKKKLPTHYILKPKYGLGIPTLVLLEQLRTIDKQRLFGYVGTLDEEEMKEIDLALSISVGLSYGL